MLGDPTITIDSDEAIRANVMHYYHPAGTCKLGPEDDRWPSATLSGGSRAPQITVADCSLMPQVPRANTNIPAVVIGERIAGILIP